MHGATLKSRRRARSLSLAALALGCCGGGWTVGLADGQVPGKEEVARAAYRAALERWQDAEADPDAAWKLGRACFDWAEFATNDTQRADLARQGIDACQQALEGNPELAAGYYYLGMNQGQLARTLGLGALKLVQRMERHFSRARELDPQFDEAGPDRNLGLLYLEAPGWPVSLGNRSKARTHLERAVALAPVYPENQLNLMEAYARWEDTEAVRKALQNWKARLDTARERYAGSQWYWDWRRWEERLAAVRRQYAPDEPPSNPIPSARE